MPALGSTTGSLAHCSGSPHLAQGCGRVGRCILHPSRGGGTVLSHPNSLGCDSLSAFVVQSKLENCRENICCGGSGPWWHLENLVFCGRAVAEADHLLLIAPGRCFGNVIRVLLMDVSLQLE